MKHHITKVIAVVVTVAMLISLVPVSALSALALSVDSDDVVSSIFDNVVLGKDTVTNTERYAAGATGDDGIGNKVVDNTLSPYEPYATTDESHPFLPGGDAWMDLSKIYYGAPATPGTPITKWSANTSVVNITGTGEKYGTGNGVLTGKEIYAIDDMNLIDEYLWVDGTREIDGKTENGIANSDSNSNGNATTVVKKGTDTAYVYNRYDAMQGKWGLTLDKNVSSVAWTPTWAKGYYGTTDLNNSILYLSDTPYLYYSTEALDSTQMAISLLIGVRTQDEKRTISSNPNLGQTTVTQDATDKWEYRWYTITDNSKRPGIDPTPNDDKNETLDYSMVPNVTKSGVVAENIDQDKMNGAAQILDAIQAQNSNGLDPMAIAAAAGKTTDDMYVSGAITGCIDFTQLLPTLMGVKVEGSNPEHDSGREDIKYKIVQVRVDTKTADGAKDSAARINYMYFGPGQAAVYTPQSTEGNDVNGVNWMWAQNDDYFGDENPNDVAKEEKHWFGNETGFDGYDSGYTNGWENGQAVSITNTPNDPQLMTIDTYGDGHGQLITYEQYQSEMKESFTKGSIDPDSRVWKYTDTNGKTQYLEAEYNNRDYNYYIMVTVPIRKWVNVLGDSRKMSFSMKVLQYGKDSSGNTLKLDPTFCMWGNDDGSLGCGHTSIRYGARYRNEGMLAVFGNGYYHVDCQDNFLSAEIDKTIGNSLFYDGSDCWFDMLRSPYLYTHTVTTANKDNGFGEEMIGYTFVTAIRYAVPIGSKFTVQNMKGDGNSAGLNTYSTSGNIVNAFDGGTGVQPEIIVDNELNETKTTVTGSQSAGYTYTVTNNGKLKGTQSEGAAAYGPMLEQSYYTIYDMLDTERINAAGKDSHKADNKGQEQLTVYGQMWESKSGYLEIRSLPRVDYCTIMGYTYGPGNEFPIYATIEFTDSGELWGVTGVLYESWGAHFGYIRLKSGSTEIATKKAGVLYKQYKYANLTALYTAFNASGNNAGDTFMANFRNIFLNDLRNEWTLSNFIGTYTNFLGSNSGDITSHAGKHPVARDIYAESHNGVQLMYANTYGHASGEKGGNTNTSENLKDITFRAVNTTDMELDVKRKASSLHNLSLGMTRIFDEPILLHGNSINGSYPVFYYDFTAPEKTDTQNMAIALSVRVDGADKLLYLQADGTLSETYYATLSSNTYGYFSFKNLMTNSYAGKNVEIVGISIYCWRSSKYTGDNTITIRRAEIWQEETDWLDKIISTKASDMTAQIKDSMNIINDAYFHGHNEDTDGGYTISRVNNADGTGASYNRTNIGINESLSGYQFTQTDNTKSETAVLKPGQTVGTENNGELQMQIQRTTSYRKTNSNKGWSARISTDTNFDGKINGSDQTYYSKDFNSATSTGVDNVFEYRTSLGHLRVWVPAHDQASVVFESDRSFNTQNYKYLYYSYSMRDVETGISAEDKSADGKGSGVAVAIKSQQNQSESAYLEMDGSWMYFPEESPYWADQGYEDRRQFSTTMNAALDLSTLDIESVNQFVFYLNNEEDERAEFYINYLYLSNVPPTQLISNELEQVQTQYYYLMDNTGDRYSARFPTIDNPTGQVSGTNSDNDRVNPIKVVRGQYLSSGTYFNGDPIDNYGTTTAGTQLDQTTGSVGKYEKTYGWTDATKNILFYMGESDDLNDINDYYDYKDRGRIYTIKNADGSLTTEVEDPDGVANVYDMLWSYGRWFTGDGESGLNIMYIGDPNVDQSSTGSYAKDAVSGALVRRYATEDHVLLRSGIVPKKFPTYFDANDGEFIYTGSSSEIANLQAVTENSYYMNENVILSYFDWPDLYDHMTKNYIQKPGYTFQYWQHCNADGSADTSFNDSGKGEQDQLLRFIKKQDAVTDYFKAVWEKNDDVKNTTATFYKSTSINADNIVTSLTTNIESDGGSYELTIPSKTHMMVNGSLQRIYGWYKYDTKTGTTDTSKIYSPSDKLYVTEDTAFVPATTASEDNTHTIKVFGGAKLYVHTTNGQLHPVEAHGATATNIVENGANGIKYTNVMNNYLLRVVPDSATAGYVWTSASSTDGSKAYIATSATVLSDNKDYYEFTAHEDISIKYGSLSVPGFYTDQDSFFVTTSAANNISNREVIFYSQYDAPDGMNVVASGTLITKKNYYDTFEEGKIDETMRLDHTSINATSVKNKSYTAAPAFRLVQSTSSNDYGEYLLRITEVKGEAVKYYARAYVIYKVDNDYRVAYGDVVAIAAEIPKIAS